MVDLTSDTGPRACGYLLLYVAFWAHICWALIGSIPSTTYIDIYAHIHTVCILYHILQTIFWISISVGPQYMPCIVNHTFTICYTWPFGPLSTLRASVVPLASLGRQEIEALISENSALEALREAGTPRGSHGWWREAEINRYVYM